MRSFLIGWFAVTSLLSVSYVRGELIAVGVFPDWAVVADEDNPANGTGYGSVDHKYRIGKHEITNGQYRTFLNAVSQTDTHGLYSSGMNGAYGGIVRVGSPESYSYVPKGNDDNWDDRPVNYVSFYDAARFANWMHNGQPGLQSPVAQDGASTEDGAYDMSLGANLVRKPGARYFVPDGDEWYKAAYYDPNKPGAAGYWTYGTRSDDQPDAVASGSDSGNSANFGALNLGPYYYTAVGAYGLSYSGYGLFDIDGNISEWTESSRSNGNRDTRGGRWNFGDLTQRNANWPPGNIDMGAESDNWGFRIATTIVPEPATSLMAALGAASLVLASGRNRRRR